VTAYRHTQRPRQPKHYASLPKTVRVGSYTFRVEVEEFEDAEASHTFGHMNPVNQKIRVRPGMTPQNLANTFIHETLHAISWFMAIGEFSLNEDTPARLIEEEYVTKLANGLCSFWQDNPQAAAWFGKTVRMPVEG
jgi:hypothetical protein